MGKRYKMTLLAVIAAFCAVAASADNDYFTIVPPDDSWIMNDDGGALHAIGARAQLYRNDARHRIIELGRVDCLIGAFDPAEYLKQQIVGKEDVFAKEAERFSEIGDTSLLGYPAKRVLFQKMQRNTAYNCMAIAFNSGFTTFLIIEAHRADAANVVGWVIGNMKLKASPPPLGSVAQYVDAAQAALAKHRLPIYANEYLNSIKMSVDSTTVEMEIVIPYTKADAINVPAFVQVMRDHVMKSFKQQVRLNMMFAAIVSEQKAMRYTYLDNSLMEIGTLLVTPPEYQMKLRN